MVGRHRPRAALRPGLNYLSPYGLQSAHARREVAIIEMVCDNRPLLGAFLIPPALPVVLTPAEATGAIDPRHGVGCMMNVQHLKIDVAPTGLSGALRPLT